MGLYLLNTCILWLYCTLCLYDMKTQYLCVQRGTALTIAMFADVFFALGSNISNGKPYIISFLMYALCSLFFVLNWLKLAL
jgi:hypothetical protein